MNPLVSTIIPTSKRPETLTIAVDSALAPLSEAEGEVIVVPNGPDRSWVDALRHYSDNPAVRVVTLSEGNANAARNAGLAAARGEFIRFLDDDDYLYREATARQYALLRERKPDVCSGAVDRVDTYGVPYDTWLQPNVTDFVAAALSPERVSLPVAHVFRRAFLGSCRWDEALPVWQDVDWMMRILLHPDINWLRVDEPLGAYVQHDSGRVSRGTHPGSAPLRHAAGNILNVVGALEERGALTAERRKAASDGLWSLLQKGLMYEPAYWIRVAQQARRLAPGRKPRSAIYHIFPFKWLDPLWVAAGLVPARVGYLAFCKFTGRRPGGKAW